MNQLTRVQVYLEPHNLFIIDKIAKEKKVSRSYVIRKVIDKLANQQLKKPFSKNKKRQKSILMKMVGIATSKTGTIGLNVDEIYLHD